MKIDQHEPVVPTQISDVDIHWMDKKYASWILALASFAESSFAPIVIDPVLVGFIVMRRERWVRYVVVAIIFSVLGGAFGYLLGAWFFDFIGTKLIAVYGLESQFSEIATKLSANGFVFVILGAITPIPYKLVAIAGGLIHMSFATFMVASVVGRTFRLAIAGYAAHKFGPEALTLFRRHVRMIAYVVALVLIAYLVFKSL